MPDKKPDGISAAAWEMACERHYEGSASPYRCNLTGAIKVTAANVLHDDRLATARAFDVAVAELFEQAECPPFEPFSSDEDFDTHRAVLKRFTPTPEGEA